MRMWMIDPKLLCNTHLLGEHGEIHKHRHNFVKHHSMDGRFSPVVQIEPANMKKRHDALAAEMVSRGMNHRSPYEQPDISYLPEWQQNAVVDVVESATDLTVRCDYCGMLIAERDMQFFDSN